VKNAKKEDLYAGCPIYSGGKKFWVCKLNPATVWVSSTYSSKIIKREKGYTLMHLVKELEAFKMPYEELEVDEADIKAGADKQAVFLKSCCERELFVIRKEMGGKKEGWKNTRECKTCGEQINFVKVEGDSIMLSNNYNLFWFNFTDHSYKFFKRIGA
jgi:hypothetical protein